LYNPRGCFLTHPRPSLEGRIKKLYFREKSEAKNLVYLTEILRFALDDNRGDIL
jgi:hypothetical protein